MLPVWKAAGVLACALFLSGCLTPPDFDTGGTIRSALASEPAKQDIRFVTTRCDDAKSVDPKDAKAALLSKRCWDFAPATGEVPQLPLGLTNGPAVHCGTATITVAGKAQQTGTAIADFKSELCDTPFAAIRAEIDKSACHCALIYVHGFNTTLPYALKRAGQLALDLGYHDKGVPILFSFGASGRLGDYANDVEAAELAVPALHRLLVALKGYRVDIVAHSMGSRIALRAIVDGDAPAVRQMVVAAPDVDPAAFLQLAEAALKGGTDARLQRLTVYTAAYDTAMAASAYTHYGRDRTGEGLPAAVSASLTNTDVVDASNLATTGYGHSYFAESAVVISDIKAVLDGLPACKPNDPVPCPRSITWTSDKGLIIPCPEGQSCSPSLYQRFVLWITRLRF